MELKTFVSSTLTQIAQGVEEAKKSFREIGGEVNPFGFVQVEGGLRYGRATPAEGQAILLCDVHFEVSLTSENSSSETGGIGVLLGAVSLGGKTSGSDSHVSLTKVSFNVPVVLP